LVEATAHGLRATGCKTWQPQSNVHSTIAAQVEYSYEVAAPYMAVLTKEKWPRKSEQRHKWKLRA
jgi:hypothetical protein